MNSMETIVTQLLSKTTGIPEADFPLGIEASLQYAVDHFEEYSETEALKVRVTELETLLAPELEKKAKKEQAEAEALDKAKEETKTKAK